MRYKIMAFVMNGFLKFEGVQVRDGSGGDVKALRKWMEAAPKSGPWVCKACEQSVGTAEWDRVAVWVDLDDPAHYEVMHRNHADAV